VARILDTLEETASTKYSAKFRWYPRSKLKERQTWEDSRVLGGEHQKKFLREVLSMLNNRGTAGGLIAVALFIAANAAAAPILVTERSALGGNDFIDWALLAPPVTSISSPFVLPSNSGDITAEVSNPTGNFETQLQTVTWNGNFALFDALLFTGAASPGPIVISFEEPVVGAGAQIQSFFLGAFTARIDVFDIGDSLIGSFSLLGDSNTGGDNSAVFLGVLDTMPSITRIEYHVDHTGLRDEFAINRLELVTAVAEPASILLFGSGLATLNGVTWRKQRRRRVRMARLFRRAGD
jgi:hypothetical protein